MGTYLYAHVEFCQEGGVWDNLCDWNFGKSYRLMDATYTEDATKGWPADSCVYRDEDDDVYAKQVTTLAELERVDDSHWSAFENVPFRALIECCRALKAGGFQVRVLWGRD